MPMKSILMSALVASCVAMSADAAEPPRLKMWNLTPETLVDIRLAPAGSSTFGDNQCANDKDGQVEFDEMVRITRTPPGTYDLRLRDVKGRTCFARRIQVPAEGNFSVGEKELVDCAP